MLLKAGAGIVLCAVGTVFVLQGTNVLRGSGMSGEGQWAVIGSFLIVAGLILFALTARSRRA